MKKGISYKTTQKCRRLLIPPFYKLTKELHSADDPSLTHEGLEIEKKKKNIYIYIYISLKIGGSTTNNHNEN